MIDMSELMFDPDFIQPIEIPVLRFSGSYDGNGLYKPNPPETVQLTMVIQQSTFKQLQALPEGERNGDFINWWSHYEIILANGVDSEQSDVILWRGKYYRVIRCSDRSDNGFWEGIAQAAPLTAGLFEVIPQPPGPGPEQLYSISGTVSQIVRIPRIAGVQMDLEGTRTAQTFTDLNGNYSFVDLPAGVYIITPTLAGFDFVPRNIVLNIP